MVLPEEEQEKILNEARNELNRFYNGDPEIIIFGYNEEKCKIFVSALFKCIYGGQGVAAPRNGLEKRMIADLVRKYPVEDLFAIFDMGKMAGAGNKEARLDLVKWYSAQSGNHGLMAGGVRREAERILKKYRTEYLKRY